MNQEVNVQVAERIMGWKHLKRISDDQRFFFPPDAVTSGYLAARVADGELAECNSGDEQNVRNFSGSIEHAWAVVERMRDKGWRITLNCGGAAWPKDWHCLFDRTAQDSDTYEHGFGDTAPEAICDGALAALAALEGK